jgi:hypothetical protein
VSAAVYDAGMLVAADRDDRDAWAEHRALLEKGLLPITTAPVVGQVSRSPRQARLRRFLATCEVKPFAPEQAHGVGALLRRSGGADIVDAHLVLVAAANVATIWTSDPDDLRHLVEQVPWQLGIQPI